MCSRWLISVVTIHLYCEVGPAPMCLDWRDICDGKRDCLNDRSDERDCLELEMNLCDAEEFQCQNGQCIPIEFFGDDRANPDCLDGSDEVGRFACDEDPSIRCEDGSHRFGYLQTVRGVTFNCGDGLPQAIGYTGTCRNRRASLLLVTLFSKSNNPSLSSQCLSAMIHYLQLNEELDLPENKKLPCYAIDQRCSTFILKSCPPLFAFPASPALFAHVYFYYSNNQTISNFEERHTPAKPMYVCYNESFCPSIPWTIRIDQLACRPFNDLSNTSGWFNVLKDLSEKFWSCSPNGIDEELCPQEGFFQCENSSKCIPNRRLVDGIADCWNASDERGDHLCNPNDPSRFSCTSESKCLSHLILRDGVNDCAKGEDERGIRAYSEKDLISLPTTCDGFIQVNLRRYMQDNSTETDENHCDLWPCSNVYTRCDEYWNCPNGIDELNCPLLSGSCLRGEFLCVSSVTFQLICLPFVNANDGHVDCLGGADERFHCRQLLPDMPDYRYRCWNSTKCINLSYLCARTAQCPSLDDARFCDQTEPSLELGVCLRYINNPDLRRHPSFRFLCALDEWGKPAAVHFALTELEPRSTSVREQRFIDMSLALDYTEASLNVAWMCNRGLLVRHQNKDELLHDCSCPPAYYGNRCQFQNQRVSLSFRVKTFEMRTVFHLVIVLTDNTSQIHSTEQRFYLGVHHCDTQFGLNLLYADRPKSDSKKYAVRIDLFEKFDLKYRASWEFPVRFSFLPVYRIAALLCSAFRSSRLPLKSQAVWTASMLGIRTPSEPFVVAFPDGLERPANDPINATVQMDLFALDPMRTTTQSAFVLSANTGHDVCSHDHRVVRIHVYTMACVYQKMNALLRIASYASVNTAIRELDVNMKKLGSKSPLPTCLFLYLSSFISSLFSRMLLVYVSPSWKRCHWIRTQLSSTRHRNIISSSSKSLVSTI